MKEFDRTNTGTLGRNKDRKTDKHPEYKGSINVGGTEYWLSAWVKTAGPNAKEPGSKFFSLAVSAKDGLPASRPAPKAAEVREDNWDKVDFNDEIPF